MSEQEGKIYGLPSGGAIRQGEILSGLCEVRLLPEGDLDEAVPRVLLAIHPLAIVLSQDCDLEQDFKSRNEPRDPQGRAESAPRNLLSSIIFCQAVTAEELRSSSPDMDTKTWKRVKFNKDERYQFLASVPAGADLDGKGLPELGVDFKRYFTLPTEVAYWQISNRARRRTMLHSPYAEHLSVRFFSFQLRIGLPVDHHRIDGGEASG